MTEGNKSEINIIPHEDVSIQQNLSEFYKLHYPPRKNAEDSKNTISFRTKSVNNIIPSKNPQQAQVEQQIKFKKSLKEKIKQHERRKDKSVNQIKQAQKFSFKHVLSKETTPQNIPQYFSKFPSKTHVDLDEYSRKNIGMKLAIQKCKDQKVKIQKVIASNKQSQETKLDYLELKKKDIEAEIKNEIRTIYQQYFKKEYQNDKNGFAEFQAKIKITMEILQQQMFNSK